MDNANAPAYLASLKETLLRHVSLMGSAPSQPIGGERPPDAPVDAKPLWDRDADAGEDEAERGAGD